MDSSLILIEQGKDVQTPTHYSTNPTYVMVRAPDGTMRKMMVDPASKAAQENHAREGIKALQQAILLNPKDMRAKSMLGMNWMCSTDETEREQGKQYMQEVAASGNPQFGPRAKKFLADLDSGRLLIQHNPDGTLYIGPPHSSDSRATFVPPPLSPEKEAALKAKMSKELAVIEARNVATNVAPHSQNEIQLPTPHYLVDSVPGKQMDFATIGIIRGKGPLLVSVDNILYSYNWNGYFGRETGKMVEKVDLPVKIDHPITAICTDPTNAWIGTDGQGLIRIPQNGEPQKIYGEKDGFPIASITSLEPAPGRLLIGFGSGNNGAFGYLDLATDKFIGMESSVGRSSSWQQAIQPPPQLPVISIKHEFNAQNGFWVASTMALYHLDLDSSKWTLTLPTAQGLANREGVHLGELASYGGYVAVLLDHGFAYCKLSQNKWTFLHLTKDALEFDAFSMAIDHFHPNHLWLGGYGKITVFDMNTGQIIGETSEMDPSTPIEFISIYDDGAFFIQLAPVGSCYTIFHMYKPQF